MIQKTYTIRSQRLKKTILNTYTIQQIRTLSGCVYLSKSAANRPQSLYRQNGKRNSIKKLELRSDWTPGLTLKSTWPDQKEKTLTAKNYRQNKIQSD